MEDEWREKGAGRNKGRKGEKVRWTERTNGREAGSKESREERKGGGKEELNEENC